jgi:hypothetical protein
MSANMNAYDDSALVSAELREEEYLKGQRATARALRLLATERIRYFIYCGCSRPAIIAEPDGKEALVLVDERVYLFNSRGLILGHWDPHDAIYIRFRRLLRPRGVRP